MLSEIRPLLNEQVEHIIEGARDLYGQRLDTHSGTTHAARIIYMQGRIPGPASREHVADAKAIVWLLSHPRPVDLGDTFKLPNGDTLGVIAAEHRISDSYTLTKVFLS